MSRHLTALLVLAVLLSGGTALVLTSRQQVPPPAPVVHDVAWFQQHPAQLAIRMAQCTNSAPTTPHDFAECENASNADWKKQAHEFNQAACKSVGWEC